MTYKAYKAMGLRARLERPIALAGPYVPLRRDHKGNCTCLYMSFLSGNIYRVPSSHLWFAFIYSNFSIESFTRHAPAFGTFLQIDFHLITIGLNPYSFCLYLLIN